MDEPAEAVLTRAAAAAVALAAYKVLLRRAPEPGAVEYWSQQLLDGATTIPSLLEQFLASDEFRDKLEAFANRYGQSADARVAERVAEVMMTPNERALFSAHLAACATYVEFGAGGSTCARRTKYLAIERFARCTAVARTLVAFVRRDDFDAAAARALLAEAVYDPG